MQTVLDLSFTKARQYFLESENYCNMNLPKYIEFGDILSFVQQQVKNKELKDILAKPKAMPSSFEGVNYKILKKKDAMYSYRSIQLANPFLYYLLVRKMTTEDAWNEILTRFKKFSVPQIEVAGIPKVKSESDKSHQAAAVSFWWEGMEQRSLELALQYRYMLVTDITNCYPSMYTHSIAWAIMGKNKAKLKKGKHGYLGNVIDTYIQGMQYGQTNGIPLESTLFDFIAEIILGYADKILSLRIRREKIEDYKILRYRDDYRIFANSKEQLERIAFLLHEVLGDFNLQLNSKKTKLSEDVITDSIKSDKIGYLSASPFYHKKSTPCVDFGFKLTARSTLYTTVRKTLSGLRYISKVAEFVCKKNGEKVHRAGECFGLDFYLHRYCIGKSQNISEYFANNQLLIG